MHRLVGTCKKLTSLYKLAIQISTGILHNRNLSARTFYFPQNSVTSTQTT